MKRSHVCLALILIISIGFSVFPLLFPSLNALVNWGIMAILLAVLVILAFFFEFESTALGSKEIAIVSMLATISAVLRIPFAAIPSFQPCTFLIICSGYVFGPISGFTVGAMTPLISNFFLGQGPWTLYQMLAWGLIGYGAAYLRRFPHLTSHAMKTSFLTREEQGEGDKGLGRKRLIISGIICAFIFGLITNIYFWLYFAYPLTLSTLIFAQLSSLWFDASHAIGNAIFLGLFGVKTIAILERYKKRFNWVYS
jgi:energy-coupling factor transport system substrate-specific component